jgi:FkbM family methyltransferase
MSGRMWKWDTYDLRKHKDWSIANVLDIGANRGTLSMMCRILFPIATIHAIEPCKETYEECVRRAGCWGVKCYNIALGNGEKLYFHGSGMSGFNKFKEKPKESSYTVDTCSFSAMFDRFKIDRDKPYIIKVDCEGGERFMLKDTKSLDCIRGSTQTLLELHPTWGGTPEEWSAYLEQLKDTHDLLLCRWYRDEVRRYYVYEPCITFPTGRCQLQLLNKKWQENADRVWWI